jgi:hypothetical protein
VPGIERVTAVRNCSTSSIVWMLTTPRVVLRKCVAANANSTSPEASWSFCLRSPRMRMGSGTAGLNG